MATRELRYYGDVILTKTSRAVEKIDERIKGILDDMVDTMYEEKGIGLAAVQVGILRRLVVIDIGEGPVKLVNPEIIESEGEEEAPEACLSIPGYQGVVVRPQRIVVNYLDESGEEHVIEANGILKRVLCHEIDHLFGILYPDISKSFYEVSTEDDADQNLEEGETDDAGEGFEELLDGGSESQDFVEASEDQANQFTE